MKCPAAVLALCGSLAFAGVAVALEIPPLEGRVSDRAELLSPQARQQLERELATFERETGHQFAVLTVPSLEGDPIEDFSIRVVEQWKLGREDQDDGLLLLVVPQDRAMRIEVGYGLEGDITDALSGRIIRDVMTPRFRQGDYEGGISQAMQLLMQAGRGEQASLPAAPPPEQSARHSEGRRGGGGAGRLLHFLIITAFFILPMFGRRRRRGGFLYLGGMGGGFGGGGFSGGGGGFGGGFSGGGGGFGGGGASGRW